MAKILALDSTSKSIVAYTTSASGAAIDYVTTWGDATSSTFVEGSSDGQITSSTPTTIIAAPASSTRRVIKTINLYNAGSYSEIVTLAIVNGANTRVIVKITIAPGVTWTSDDLITYTSSISSTVVSFRNVLINGDFQVSQRTPPVSMVPAVAGVANSYTATSDFAPFSGSYTHDRWLILHQLSNAGGWTVSRRLKTTAGNVPSTQENSCGIASTATSSTLAKVGLAQIVESSNCVDLIGSPATLSFWAKRDSTVGTQITNVKAAILYWTGTPNIVPRNFVSSWNATDTIPTFAANVTAAIVSPTSYAVTDTWARFTLTSSFIPSNAQNIMVFIWNDRTDRLSTDQLYLADVQLERGLVATSFESLPLSASLARCYRYCYAVYGNASYIYGNVNLEYSPLNYAKKIFAGTIPFSQPMRSAPTGIAKSLTSGSAFDIINASNVTNSLLQRPQILTTTPYLMQFQLDSSVTTTLSSNITSTQTTIPVANNSSFPTPAAGSFGVILIGDELIRYTGKSGTTSFTGCTRGWEGTSNSSALSGASVVNTFNALPASTYRLRHTGATPSYFIANAEL